LKHVNRDKNVVQLYGTSMLSDGRLLLVTELMEGGDLRCALNHPATAEKLAWHRGGKGVALDIARGLTSLHAANVIHRDLKSSNILLNTVFEAKIADVGISAIHSRGYLAASAGRVVGTFAWSAPELLMGQRCTEKVDIYSCGVMLYELATGKVPKRGALDLPSPSERCPAELLALITDCVNVNPHDRPSARDVYFRILEAVPPLLMPH
jgi:serine/threonine protein kinase